VTEYQLRVTDVGGRWPAVWPRYAADTAEEPDHHRHDRTLTAPGTPSTASIETHQRVHTDMYSWLNQTFTDILNIPSILGK